jgi:hypothetical protein
MVDEAFFHSHPKLYHYTNISAFQNIFDTQTLWASHYSTLNDKSEMTHLNQVLSERISIILPEFKSKIGQEIGAEDDIERDKNFIADLIWANPVHKETRRKYFDPYIVSFCTHEDSDQGDKSYIRRNGLLSQWIAYGGTAGCVVVFDTQKLYSLLREEAEGFLINTDIFPMTYVNNSEVVKYIYPDFDDILLKFCVEVYRRTFDRDICRKYLEATVNISERLKHIAFSEESEIRISVSLHTDKNAIQEVDPDGIRNPKKVHYRMKGNLLVPYIVLFGCAKQLPIEKLIVGPNSEQDRIADALQRMCEPSGIEVTRSSTPYISA